MNKKQLISYSDFSPLLKTRYFNDVEQKQENIVECCNRLLGEKPTTLQMLLGTEIHKSLLGKDNAHDNNQFAFSPSTLGVKDFRSKLAQQMRDEQIKKGGVQVGDGFIENIKTVSEAVKKSGLFKDKKQTEKEVIKDGLIGHIDCITKDNAVLDVKTTAQFERSLRWARENYKHQLFFYKYLSNSKKVPELLLIEVMEPFSVARVIFVNK
jgi:hypothetical protein